MNQNILKKISELYKIAKIPNSEFVNTDSDEFYKVSGEITKFFTSEAAGGIKTSEKTINKILKEYILNTNQESFSSENLYSKIIDFNKQTFDEVEVILPFTGARIENTENIYDFSIEIFSEELRKSILDKIAETINNSSKSTDKKEINQQISSFDKILLKPDDFLVLKFKTSTDPQFAIESAEIRLELLLNFLNFASLIREEPKDGIVILPGISKINIYSNKILLFPSNVQVNFSYSKSRTINISELRQNTTYSTILDSIFIKLRNEKIEYPLSSILSSITWASSANKTFLLENKILNLIIAIESLFTGIEKSNISGSISENVAFLISNDLEERYEIYDTMKLLYKTRNDLAHGSNSKKSKKEFDKALELYVKLINTLFSNKNRFTSSEIIQRYLQEQKFK